MKILSNSFKQRPTYRNFHHGFSRAMGSSNARKISEEKKSTENSDSIVISGISGRYPKSDSLKELKQNLYGGIDMISEQNRWKAGNKVPSRYGFIKNLDKFDANFFGITPKLADAMDPQQRKLLEVTFEALLDAGINPETLRGSKTGVYVGTLGGEAFDYWLMKGGNEALDGYGAMGIPNFMMANRISYTFDLKGPSMVISTGCSASLIALESAVEAIKSGKCDAAIVSGATVHLNPCASYDLHFVNALSPDGKCHVFDDAANGYVRSEAIVSLLIQKKKDAKRSYATIRHIKSNSDGYKSQGLVFPSSESQENLLKQTYEEVGIDPGSVSYFEAHGTGTPAGDPQELEAISKVLCHQGTRKAPLLIGSVKSNLGHAESAAGLTSISKVLIAINEGIIPGNLHFNEPNARSKHLFDGTLQVVSEHMPWNGGLVGINSFGLGGTNVHLILESAGCSTEPSGIESDLPVLLPFSGRTKESVEESLADACKIENSQFQGLIQQVFEKRIPGHGFRGYGILRNGQEEDEAIVQVEAIDGEKRPLWFIFPGMGSQWNEMGKDLMKIDAFAESMHRSEITLKNAGLDLLHLLRPGNSSIFNNIRDSLVSITAVQIALYDTMMSLGLKPEGFVGHSSGEILCAYADGCLSAEEALLVGDARGRAFQESSKFPGGMAAVGLSWSDIKSRCPPNIYPACHNVTNSVSVSGPLEDIRNFVKELQQEGIFVKEINSCNCAPHSPYVYPAMDLLFKYMNEIYQDDRPRTSRWISSSIPESDWDTLLAKTSSPAYHVYNMGNAVLFQEAIQHIPSNAVVVEIAPHGLFKTILKGALSKDCTLIAPMHSMVEDKLSYFLSSVGQIHNAGIDVDVKSLYPPIQTPVKADTPPLSPLIKWDHSESWVEPVVVNPLVNTSGAQIVVDIKEKAYSFLKGHKLDNHIIFPAMGYLHLAWKSLANSYGVEYHNLPVVFENVSFERATFLSEDKPTEFAFSLLPSSGAFEIREEGVTVVKGQMYSTDDPKSKFFNVPITSELSKGETPFLKLKTPDIYKELKLRGYNYSGAFRGIHTIDNEGKWARVKWDANWVSFLDSVLQTISLSTLKRSVIVPTGFQQVVIDPAEFLTSVSESQDSTVPVSVCRDLKTVKCPGIEIRGISTSVIPHKKQKENLSLEEYRFSPFFDTTGDPSSTQNSTLAGLIDLILENKSQPFKLYITDIFTKAENSLAKTVSKIMSTKPRFQAEISMLTLPDQVELIEESVRIKGSVATKETVEKLVPDFPSDIVFLDDSALLSSLASSMQDNGFLVLQSENIHQVSIPQDLVRISRKLYKDGSFSLLKKKPLINSDIKAINVDHTYEWILKLQSAMKSDYGGRIYLNSQNDQSTGIIGLVKCLRLEPGGERIRCIYDPEGHLDLDFSNPSLKLKQILQQDLVMNVLQNGSVGSYRHFPLTNYNSEIMVKHAHVGTLTPGDLSGLRWIESPLSYQNDCSSLCEVKYASVNPQDLKIAQGKFPGDVKDGTLGEFSGLDFQGNPVMGIANSNALATAVLADEFLWRVPENWSMEDGATVPLAYVTAYYALISRARLSAGKSILIHAGTSPVGQAAIHIALDKNCQVFTTVGSPEEGEYIRKLFPDLQDEFISNSWDGNFEPQILKQTSGRGVDVILDSLPENQLQASMRCLTENGRFLDLAPINNTTNSIDMRHFKKSMDFQRISLQSIFTECSEEKEKLKALVADGILRGVVKPLPRKVFSSGALEDAFRCASDSTQNVGKVLLDIQREEPKTDFEGGTSERIKAIGRSYFDSNKTYIIIGGLGGLGLEVGDFLVERGGRHLVLVSRSGITNGYQDLCVRKWIERGVQVDTPTVNLSERNLAENFLQNLISQGKQIGGIFNSSLVLKDGSIEDQTPESFEAVCAPKSHVTKHLDELTRKHCKDLDYFVVFSSAACGKGNALQSNYGFANSAMEQICEKRQKDGLHGLAIQWGLIAEAGFVAEKLLATTTSLPEDSSFEGTVPQRISSCLKVLDLALQQNVTVISSMVLADKRKEESRKSGLLTTLGSMFGLKNLKKMSPSTKLVDLGMDSLVGLELKLLLEREYDLPFTPNELRKMIFADLIAIDSGTFVKGQDNRMSAGSEDFFQPTTDSLVKLNTGDDDVASPIFIVHGLEGHTEKFMALSSELKCDAYGFQFTNPENITRLSDLARIYIEDLKSVQPDGPYTIAGYSSGAAIAYEMASQLENDYKDEVSNIIVLDGCFNWKAIESLGTTQLFQQVLEISKPLLRFTDDDGKKFLDTLTPGDMSRNEELLAKWVETINPALSGTVLRNYIRRLFKLGQIVQEYDPSYKYKGKAHLIKASEKSFLMIGIHDEKHYMEEQCECPIAVHTVKGNHYSFLDAENVKATANIINEICCRTQCHTNEAEQKATV